MGFFKSTIIKLANLLKWFLTVLLQRFLPKKHFKILLVGAGKSTIINAITNYFRDNIKVTIQTNWLKVKEEDFPVNSEADVDKIYATPFCIKYDIFDPDNPGIYTFIDIPGLNDIRGDEQDDLNLQELIQSAISHQDLSAIVFVADGTEARLKNAFNAFERLSNSLPDNIVKENLLLVLTKTTNSGSSFSLNIFQNEVAELKQIFYIDNRVFCSNPSDWRNNKRERRHSEISWDDSNKEIKQLLGVISKLKSVSTRDFYRDFYNMKTIIEDIRTEILDVKMDLQNIYLVKEKFVSAKEQPIFKTTDKEIMIKSIINIDYKNSVCITCEKVCHENCKGFFCDCFSDWLPTCNLCGCSQKSHCKPKFKIVEQTIKISKSGQYLEVEELLHNERTSYDETMNKQRSELNVLKARRRTIMNLCNKMKSICSRCDFTKELSITVKQLKELTNHIEDFVVKEEVNKEIELVLNIIKDF